MKKFKVLETGLANPSSSSEIFKFKSLKKANKFIKDAIKTCIFNESFDENGLNSDKKTKKDMKEIYRNCYKIL